MTLLLFSAGLLLLIAGAELLIRGASRLAGAWGITPLVIGLTVVAFGTSSPELAVSIKAAVSGQAGIAMGNVVGSNIFNVLFILGLAALIVPLSVSQQLVRFDVPLLIALSVLVLLISLDGRLTRLDGVFLVAALLAYTSFVVYQSRRESRAVAEEYAQEFGHGSATGTGWLVNGLLVAGGLVLLVTGSRLLVDSATAFAIRLGVSEVVVGLTIVAAGTSLPEVVTSVMAAVRGERDIAVGNVVGSNIFNLMGVLGVAGLVAPAGIEIPPSLVAFDLPVMTAVAFACLPIFFTDGAISRAEGALLLGYYVAYTAYLVMASTRHDAIEEFGAVMLYFMIPLTLATLVLIAARRWRSARAASD